MTSEAITQDMPKTRSVALATGEALYLTGKPCRHGHVAPRHTANGNCSMCEQERRRKASLKGIKVTRDGSSLTIVVPVGMAVQITHHNP